MALPTVATLRDYLRIETSAEDAVITGVLADATALVERDVGGAGVQVEDAEDA